MTAEFDFIARYLAPIAPGGATVRAGIGDDCAIVDVPGGQALAVSIDTLVAGIHFPRATRPEDVGWKALACGLSDLAAAGADPAWCTLALTLPGIDDDWGRRFARGFGELARGHEVALVGGDTTRGTELAVTVQVAGHVGAGEWLARSGARPGDAVYVSGSPGEAAAALDAVLAGEEPPAGLRARLDRPTPRVALGTWLRGRASACIDVSDGLAADAGHVATASGVGILLEEARLPLSEALVRAGPERALQRALTGGDDYELCFTGPEGLETVERAGEGGDVPVTRIGDVDTGPGVRLRRKDGRLEPIAGGYDHFDAPRPVQR